MKKNLFLFLMLLSGILAFAQKSIDNPQYGLSNLPGKLTKIELTETATVIHFYIKYQPGKWISVPKNTYIKDVNGNEKLMVTKTEGIPLDEQYTIPESGEVNYKVFFPKLEKSINKIDFGEGNNNPNNWSVYDIIINEQKEISVLPKELKGNWFQADGSNQWDYGFYDSNAILDKAIWNYKTVEKKKNNYTIVLERNGKQKTVYAQTDKNRTVKFGAEKEKLTNYSNDKIINANYKSANDKPYSEMTFTEDTATYSGVIKSYTLRSGRKTGNVYVNNIFTGKQDSYLIKIAEDGSFSVKFPVNHPQFIFTQLPNANQSVFVEPGKETFQFIDGENNLFMGDCASVNADLKALEKISFYENYYKLTTSIIETSPEDYKKKCLEIKYKQLQALEVMSQKQFFTQKALQIKKLDIEFLSFQHLLSYEMYIENEKRNKSQKKPTVENKTENHKINASYYDFITKSILNNELAVIAQNYSPFINRLRFAEILRPSVVSYSYTSLSDTAEQLQKSGEILTKEDLEMIEASKKMDKSINRVMTFMVVNDQKNQEFRQNHKEIFDKLQKEKPNTEITIVNVADYLSKNGTPLSTTEKEFVTAFKTVNYTKEEQEIQKQFNNKYGEVVKTFSEKYKTNIEDGRLQQRFQNALQKTKEKLRAVFGIQEAFVFDVITLQESTGELERNFTPYKNDQLKWIQTNINNPTLADYMVLENDKIKAKLEANKKQTGFAIHTVKKSEGDELFDSMISKFKGKVVYVDFWATWCGPCMHGIKGIAPLKEEMKKDDVVFLYITNQSSPEKAWNNTIPNIKGEHYRVSNDEWNYLSQKFNISGIPHYVLVNKKGEVVKPQMGHNSNENLKRILEGQMK